MVKGRIIAQGRYATVYEWDEDTILKLFREGLPPQMAKREFLATRLLFDHGMPVPEPHELVTVKARDGIVLDMVEGPSMQERLDRRPHPRMDVVTGQAGRLADIHATIHDLTIPRLPSQRRRMVDGINRATSLDDRLRDRVLAILEDLPDGDAVCHGDLHPRNVIMSPFANAIIDWQMASKGNPHADVARSLLVMEAGGEWDSVRVRELRRTFRSSYLHKYCFAAMTWPEEVYLWRAPVAAARLGEGFPGEERWLLHTIREGLV
ncbi:MAG: phosphotransferase [Thermoplasmata archaeon]|nr:phosphotransferase [Thermoplasmata archaeon]NIS13077.1 phosphotransferase [Thermoplasmata archaeon]NIV79724.1 phosphotransferase [Thermoplasmata archaeon]NIW83543.1 phosphotransferase [Thermoplasmata archaeon]